MQKLLLIAVAGALGTLSRYGVSLLMGRLVGGTLPWGTFTANVCGCFLFGFVWSLAEGHMVISVETRSVVLTGFMGAFTTFSTFIFDTSTFVRASQWVLTAGNLISQVVIGLIFLFVGLRLGHLL